MVFQAADQKNTEDNTPNERKGIEKCELHGVYVFYNSENLVDADKEIQVHGENYQAYNHDEK